MDGNTGQLRDAQLAYGMPLNCVLLAGIIICAPLLRSRSLLIVSGVVLGVNLATGMDAYLTDTGASHGMRRGFSSKRQYGLTWIGGQGIMGAV